MSLGNPGLTLSSCDDACYRRHFSSILICQTQNIYWHLKIWERNFSKLAEDIQTNSDWTQSKDSTDWICWKYSWDVRWHQKSYTTSPENNLLSKGDLVWYLKQANGQICGILLKSLLSSEYGVSRSSWFSIVPSNRWLTRIRPDHLRAQQFCRLFIQWQYTRSR